MQEYLETAKRHIFGNHRIKFGLLFPRSCRFHVQRELQIAFFPRYKSKNRYLQRYMCLLRYFDRNPLMHTRASLVYNEMDIF